MSFNRLQYDACAYAKELQQSTDPLEYNLFRGKYETCKDCPNGEGPNNLDFGVRSDVESDLKGQIRLGSKCDGDKYPAFSTVAPQFNPPIICQGIYNLTPVYTGYPSTNPIPLVKPTNSGLKDLSTYGNKSCLL